MNENLNHKIEGSYSVHEIKLDHFVKRKVGYIIFSRWEMIKQYQYFIYAYIFCLVSFTYYFFDGLGSFYLLLLAFATFFISLIAMLIDDALTASRRRFDWNTIENYILHRTDLISLYQIIFHSAFQLVRTNFASSFVYQIPPAQQEVRRRLRIFSGFGFFIGTVLLVLSIYFLVAGSEHFFKSFALYSSVATLSIITLGLSMWVLMRSVRMSQPTAEQIMDADPRKPILFLRSFADDKILIRQCAPFINSRRLPAISLKLRFEEAFSDLTNEFGPTIALGDPNKSTAQLGVARDHYSDENWQEKISDWISNSQFIFMIAGRTFWVKWELESIIDNDQLDKLIVLFPPKDRVVIGQIDEADRQKRWNSFVDCFANTKWKSVLRNVDPVTTLLAFFYGDHFITITCDQDWENDYKLAIILAVYGMQSHNWTSI